ncbi:adenylate/guanylate cyclase domain-containing protein [Rhizobiales bacterium]|uniref:adenylate/guanylate cyclase domain-containing protein n=1 Tax=Hongsoonwoonella zoysiae TaxID=2821844 RepID=UPI001561351F|nr:adenylate/guanylate cyclase domain-containing protein [Hongsoonwoonella zoysiae]NRG16916.1 adenylate/guanylate cyclase domain-containing protein [Hongsoonwoonella zoysiae]
MNLERFNELLLKSIGVGLAVADAETFEVLVTNDCWDDWFGKSGKTTTLKEVFPEFDVERLQQRLAAEKPYLLDAAAPSGKRKISLTAKISRHSRNDLDVLMVECQNVTKIKEMEYMIQSYSSMVEKQNRELRREKERVEKVLLNIMPKTIYDEWKQFGVTAPQRYDNVSILMLDFAGFTDMAVTEDPPALISELNDIFTSFDRIVEQFGCERLKTVGDAYIAVSGISEASPDHASNIAAVALRILHFLDRRNVTHHQTWRCRMGLATAPVVGSIVGVQKYVYDLFGPGMNLAARLEALADPMQILLHEEFRMLLDRSFVVKEIGPAKIRGFSEKTIFELVGSDEL